MRYFAPKAIFCQRIFHPDRFQAPQRDLIRFYTVKVKKPTSTNKSEQIARVQIKRGLSKFPRSYLHNALIIMSGLQITCPVKRNRDYVSCCKDY